MPVTTKIYPKILERDAEKFAYDTLGRVIFTEPIPGRIPM